MRVPHAQDDPQRACRPPRRRTPRAGPDARRVRPLRCRSSAIAMRQDEWQVGPKPAEIDRGNSMSADLADPALRREAVNAALGRRPFDVLVAGGTVVDVATGELREADVGLVGKLIASVHPRGERTDAARIVDASGGYVAPGL